MVWVSPPITLAWVVGENTTDLSQFFDLVIDLTDTLYFLKLIVNVERFCGQVL